MVMSARSLVRWNLCSCRRRFLSSVSLRPPFNSRGRGSGGGGPGGLPRYIWVGVGGTAVLGIGTYYTFLDEVPVTKRRRWLATSLEWEQRLGDQDYKRQLTGFRGKILPPDHRASATVRRVGERIAQASQMFARQHNLSPLHSKPFTYTVVRTDAANAFVVPGNHVFVTTGLFRYVKDEDDLAAVLGHECAHGLVRHAGERISSNLVLNILGRLSLVFDPTGGILAILLPAANLFRELPNSRQQEMEADQIGVLLAAEACFDPRAAPRVFQAMKDGDGHGTPPEFLSTHPSHDRRITKFNDYMPEALAVYRGMDGNRCGHIRSSMQQARQIAAQQAQAREQKGLPTRTSPRNIS